MSITPTSVATSVATVAVQHPTTAAGGVAGALTTVILSGMIHDNIHMTIEETIAWNTLLTCFLGWFLRFASKRWPVLDINAPVVPPADPVVVEPVSP